MKRGSTLVDYVLDDVEGRSRLRFYHPKSGRMLATVYGDEADRVARTLSEAPGT